MMALFGEGIFVGMMIAVAGVAVCWAVLSLARRFDR